MSNTRQKTYFTSKELPHIWAHQSAPRGRCPSAETFEGDTYYSYSTPIARLVKGKGGVQGVIINASGYSITTSGHLTGVRQAVSHIENKFSITGIQRGWGSSFPKTGKQLRDFYLQEFLSPFNSEPSKYAHVNAVRFLSKVDSLDEAIRACEFFGIACKQLQTKRAKLQPKVDAETAILQAKEDRKKELDAKREAKKNESAIATAREWLADDNDKRTLSKTYLLEGDEELYVACGAKNARLNATKAEDWKAGHNIELPYGLPIMLRREEAEIVTSKGVRIPYDHAKKAFALVKRCHDRQEGFQENGSSIKVGHYRIDRIDADGTVHAGCHQILFPDILELANKEGW